MSVAVFNPVRINPAIPDSGPAPWWRAWDDAGFDRALVARGFFDGASGCQRDPVTLAAPYQFVNGGERCLAYRAVGATGIQRLVPYRAADGTMRVRGMADFGNVQYKCMGLSVTLRIQGFWAEGTLEAIFPVAVRCWDLIADVVEGTVEIPLAHHNCIVPPPALGDLEFVYQGDTGFTYVYQEGCLSGPLSRPQPVWSLWAETVGGTTRWMVQLVWQEYLGGGVGFTTHLCVWRSDAVAKGEHCVASPEGATWTLIGDPNHPEYTWITDLFSGTSVEVVVP